MGLGRPRRADQPQGAAHRQGNLDVRQSLWRLDQQFPGPCRPYPAVLRRIAGHHVPQLRQRLLGEFPPSVAVATIEQPGVLFLAEPAPGPIDRIATDFQ